MANSKRKCPACGSYNRVDDGMLINNRLYCGMDCATSYAKKMAPMARAKHEREERVNCKRRKKKLERTNLKWQHQQTQRVFNKMRVLQELKWFRDRGIEPYCISCGKINMDWCCGHFKTVGAQSNLRYEESNTHLQCNKYCNQSLSGNLYGNKNTRGYIAGLYMRFGDEIAQSKIDFCNSNTEPKKWHWDELEQFRSECREKIKRLSM